MRIRQLVIGLGICGIFAVGTILAQTTATKPATAPATATANATTKVSTTSAPAASTAASVAACIRCHPWDKVIEASAKYVTPEGEKSNPHIYVPHKSKKEADIPDCMKCHTKHSLAPLPKKGEIDLKKMNIKWCYDVCHHEKNLERCDKCH